MSVCRLTIHVIGTNVFETQKRENVCLTKMFHEQAVFPKIRPTISI